MIRPRFLLCCSILLAGSPAWAGLTFVRPPAVTVSVWPKFFAAGDFDGDGIGDLVVSSSKSRKIDTLLSDPGGFFSVVTVSQLSYKLARVASGDLNGDGMPEIVVAVERSHGVFILIGQGNGVFATNPVFVSVGRNPFGVAIADFDGNNANDLAVSDHAGDRVFILLNRGLSTPSFRNGGDYAVGRTPEDIIAADFNGDNIDDIVTLNQGGRRVKDVTMLIFETVSSGLPVFRRLANFGVGARPSDLISEDFNNDGIRDLAVVNRPIGSENGEVEFLIGRGDGLLDRANTLSVGCPFFSAVQACSPRALGAGDLDGDGDADLVVLQTDPREGSVTSLLSLYVGMGDTTFVPGPVFSADPGPRSVIVGEFSGDGLPDIVVGSERLSTVQLYKNASAVGPGDGKVPGQACDNGDECFTNLCIDGVCCRTECLAGELCNLPGVAGTCTPLDDNRPNGFPCDEAQPEQCLSQFCVNSVCCIVGDCTGGRCDIPGKEGTCAPLLANGSECIFPEHCSNGECVDGFCCDTACPNGRCDIPGKEGTCSPEQGLGSDCTADEQCVDPGICDLVGRICCTEFCSDDEECAIDGNGCVTIQNPTLTPGVIGGPCDIDDDCIDAEAPWCTDGVCCVTPECETGQVCAIGSGVCATPTPTVQFTPTRTPPECVCPDGGPCDANGFCSVDVGTSGGCSMTGKGGGAGSDLLLAGLLPAALWLARRWQVGQVRQRARRRQST